MIKYAIIKSSRLYDGSPYSGSTWDIAGIRDRYKEYYTNPDEAVELMNILARHNTVGFSVTIISCHHYVMSCWDGEFVEISFFKDGCLGTCISREKLEEFGVDVELLDYLISDKTGVVLYKDQELTDIPSDEPKYRQRKVYVKNLVGFKEYLKDLALRKQSISPRQK